VNLETAYLDALKLWDCADASYAIGLTSENLGSGPEPRVSSDGRPSADGSINRTRYWGPRIVELTGYVQGADKAERTATLDDLRGAFTLREAHVLRFTPAGQAQRRLAVVVASKLDAPMAGDPSVIEWGVTLEAPDPRMYVEALQAASFMPFDGPSVTIENAGSVAVPVVVEISSGDGTVAAIENVTTGEKIAFAPALVMDTSRHIVADTGARTLTDDGDPAPQFVDASETTWFELAPGSNEIGLDVTGASADLEVLLTWRDGWL